MQKGERYIIEIGEVINHCNEPCLARIKGFHTLTFDEEGLSRLKRLNSDVETSAKSYQKGLSDAWEAARMICGEPANFLEDAGFESNMDDEYEFSCDVISSYSAEQAIKLLRDHVATKVSPYDIKEIPKKDLDDLNDMIDNIDRKINNENLSNSAKEWLIRIKEDIEVAKTMNWGK